MGDLFSYIVSNLNYVREEIRRAALGSGRNSNDIQLVVVSKNHSPEVMNAAISAGIRDFGENYPEELYRKLPKLSIVENVKFHMIGHLQSRKIDLLIDDFHYFHALDSLSLAEKINKRLMISRKQLPVFIECNLSGESSKYGWHADNTSDWVNIAEEIRLIRGMENLKVCGLMTMPPLSDDPSSSRSYFIQLREFRNWMHEYFHEEFLNELSMGTSFDYPIAIEEGATIIRVGTAILGPRINPDYLENR